jgi:predicted GNAT superfamily acetyltransferase
MPPVRLDSAAPHAVAGGDTRPRRARDHAFSLRRLSTSGEFDDAVALQHDVWGDGFADVVPAAVLRVVQYVGGVVAGAFTDADELAGFVFGVSGIRDGRLSHWSDTLAVRQKYRDRGLGEDLKRFQRDLLLPLGIERVYWTFDPLESKNAHLNFNRLGVTASEYHRDFYGDTHSPLHEDIGTDRLVASWAIGDSRVAALLDDAAPRGVLVGEMLAGVPLVNVTLDGEAGPVSAEPDLALRAPRVRIAIPADIQQLKTRSPEAAREWRRVTRLAFEAYFARGYSACALVRRGACSEYLLDLGDAS